jgi:plasmid stability protein
MPTMVVRKLEESVHSRIKKLAASHGLGGIELPERELPRDAPDLTRPELDLAE